MHHPEDRDRALRRAPAAESTLVPPAGGTGAARMAGHVLGGWYEIRGVLGRGGMGEVWLARDLKLQVEEALQNGRVK